MSTPPMSSKARLALPQHLLNGDSHASHKSSPARRTSVNVKEREALTASIQSSHIRRQPIDFDAREEPFTNGHGFDSPTNPYEEPVNPTNLAVAPRDPRDETPHTPPPTLTRPAGPYTLNRPIDFDGLSWPSESEYLGSDENDS